ncbi:MAG: transcriptional repressor [Desulfobacterales bacterium]|nr:MAG: transcriptional repressor [Desulfobacterales bacterium]
MTRQRRVILEEIRNLKVHPSADDVYEAVRRRMPRISLGTVYRNLEVLSGMGEIQKLPVGGPLKRYDKNTHRHYHVRCIACNRVEDVPMDFMGDIEAAMDGSMGFRFLGHHLEFTGLCADCQEAAKDQDHDFSRDPPRFDQSFAINTGRRPGAGPAAGM